MLLLKFINPIIKNRVCNTRLHLVVIHYKFPSAHLWHRLYKFGIMFQGNTLQWLVQGTRPSILLRLSKGITNFVSPYTEKKHQIGRKDQVLQGYSLTMKVSRRPTWNLGSWFWERVWTRACEPAPLHPNCPFPHNSVGPLLPSSLVAETCPKRSMLVPRNPHNIFAFI